jgi:hypothetical protein
VVFIHSRDFLHSQAPTAVEIFRGFLSQYKFSKDLIKTFSPMSCSTYSSGSFDEKCLLSRIVSAAILHLNSPLQICLTVFLKVIL